MNNTITYVILIITATNSLAGWIPPENITNKNITKGKSLKIRGYLLKIYLKFCLRENYDTPTISLNYLIILVNIYIGFNIWSKCINRDTNLQRLVFIYRRYFKVFTYIWFYCVDYGIS